MKGIPLFRHVDAVLRYLRPSPVGQNLARGCSTDTLSGDSGSSSAADKFSKARNGLNTLTSLVQIVITLSQHSRKVKNGFGKGKRADQVQNCLQYDGAQFPGVS
jgi:hypothetical protein